MATRASKKGSARADYVCQECGYHSPAWLGRCPSCQGWNTFVEEAPATAGPGGRPVRSEAAAAEVVPLDKIPATAGDGRIGTGCGELDRVLGGGLVAGSTVLLGGDPGIGKSTLALQLARGVAEGGRNVLYVAGEEAPAQVRLRAERLGAAVPGVLVLPATDTTAVTRAVGEHEPSVVIVDSIQTAYTARVESAPGSVSQLRESAAELVTAARDSGAALVLIGHVTKEGFLAGPRVLEHMVDTVLYFEGDRHHVFRVLRAVKNRFGPASEIGVFEMLAGGLREVDNPSEAFTGTGRQEAPGSVVSACIEGSRPMLVEVQALVAASNPGSARRTTLGIDHGRVAMLAAVMERRLGLTMISQDLFVSTVGGVRVDDPGVDLAVVAALASSYVDKPLPIDLVVIGEVGLTGEVRPVSQARARVKEAVRLGFGRFVVPEACLDQAHEAGAEVVEGVASVSEAWQSLR